MVILKTVWKIGYLENVIFWNFRPNTPISVRKPHEGDTRTKRYWAGPGRWPLSVGFGGRQRSGPGGSEAGRNETANTGVGRTCRVRGVRARVCFRGGKIAAIKSGAETRARGAANVTAPWDADGRRVSVGRNDWPRPESGFRVEIWKRKEIEQFRKLFVLKSEIKFKKKKLFLTVTPRLCSGKTSVTNVCQLHNFDRIRVQPSRIQRESGYDDF